MEPVRRTLIPRRVLEQILLMVILCIPPLTRGQNVGHDLLPDGVEVRCLHFGSDALRDGELFGCGSEDRRAVFWGSMSGVEVEGERRRGGDLRVPVSPPCLFNVVGSCVR